MVRDQLAEAVIARLDQDFVNPRKLRYRMYHRPPLLMVRLKFRVPEALTLTAPMLSVCLLTLIFSQPVLCG